MIALHLGFCNDEILLWSESEQTGKLQITQKALKELGLTTFAKAKKKPCFVWLPGKKGKLDNPLPSHPLLGELPAGKYKTVINAFPVEAISLDFAHLEEILLTFSASIEPGSGIILGNSILWMVNLFTLATDVVIKELFIPYAVNRDGHLFGVWRSVLGEPEERCLRALAAEMPAVVRAISDEAENPPQSPPLYVVSELLDLMVDAVIRKGCTSFRVSKPEQSIHDAWLHSLITQDNKITRKNVEDIRGFEKQLADWTRQIVLTVKAGVKICFRLVEPQQGKEEWRLEYYLQSKEDPGLLVPLSLIWSKKKKDKETLKKVGLESIELPLMLLGQAAGIYPPLEVSLKSGNESYLSLDAAQALTFLFEYTDILTRMGFSVMFPSWWTGRNTQRKIALNLQATSPKMQSNAGMGLHSILKFNYQASLGGEKMTMKELEELAKLKSSLVMIRGEWTFIDAKQLQECLAFLKKQKEKEVTVSDLVKISLGSMQTPVEVEQINVSGWVGKLLEGLNDKKGFQELSQPQSFTGELRHYQQRGFSWLAFLKKWGFGACLADDMGLGKTVQTLALFQNDIEAGEKRPVLLICPTTVLNNWSKEAARFTPDLKVLVHHGADRLKDKQFAKSAAAISVVISSFGLLHRDLKSFQQVNWAGIVVDEAQNIKNSQTKASKAVRSLQADYRIALTGTPVENHVGDLWSIMEYLNPGMLGSLASFKERFHKPITLYRDENATLHLKKAVSPFILRRLKTDKTIIRDLPDKIESKEYCTLTKEQVSLYQAVANEVQRQVEDAEGISRKGIVLAALTRLKQVCNHPAQYFQDNSELFSRSGKLNRTLELLSEIYENKERTIIFTQYYEMGNILQQVISQYFGREVLFLHGKTSKKKRDEMIERFQTSDNAPYFFILSLKAGGTGITLTKANNVIHYDRWWNPAVEQQATDRAFRIGQKQHVQVHKLIVAGTLEEKIDELMMKKEEVAGKVVGTGEAWLSELSDNDFKSLISLSKSAIGDE